MLYRVFFFTLISLMEILRFDRLLKFCFVKIPTRPGPYFRRKTYALSNRGYRRFFSALGRFLSNRLPRIRN